MGVKLSSIGGRMARARAAQTKSTWWNFGSSAYKNQQRRGDASTWWKHSMSATKNQARRIRLSPGN